MPEMAFCGLLCGTCPVYRATAAGDRDLMVRLARDYATDTFRPRAEDMHCRGCRSEAPCAVMCGACPMRLCAVERGVESCGLCPDYPCQTVEQMIPAGAPHRLRLDGIRGSAGEAL